VNVITRRALAGWLGGAVVGVASVRIGALTARKPRIPPVAGPVVSFFLDQPYLDLSGVEEPYLPPRGLRGGDALAQLSEVEFRHIAPHG
jgi:hypothetical protein